MLEVDIGVGVFVGVLHGLLFSNYSHWLCLESMPTELLTKQLGLSLYMLLLRTNNFDQMKGRLALFLAQETILAIGQFELCRLGALLLLPYLAYYIRVDCFI